MKSYFTAEKLTFIVFMAMIVCVLAIFAVLGYMVRDGEIRTTLRECSVQELEKGYMWTIDSNGTMLSVYPDGSIQYGYYKDGKWNTDTAWPDARFADNFKLLVEDYIDGRGFS